MREADKRTGTSAARDKPSLSFAVVVAVAGFDNEMSDMHPHKHASNSGNNVRSLSRYCRQTERERVRYKDTKIHHALI